MSSPPDRKRSLSSTIRRFGQGAEPELLLKHVPRHGSLAAAPNEVVQQVIQVALDGAKHVWARMLATDDPIPLGHDGYLKVWALSEPCLPVDYILLDEAQDTNPVVLDVLRKQDAQIVYVGDKYRRIYEWRGAINAMEEAPAVHATDLTISFRFGGEIAHAANCVLEMLNAGKKLKGNARASQPHRKRLEWDGTSQNERDCDYSNHRGARRGQEAPLGWRN